MKRIKLKNFRCFNDYEMTFRPGINLLIGDNASGKTTILKALQIAVSSFFAGFNDEYTRFTGIGNNDFSRVVADDKLLPVKPIDIRFDLGNYEGLFLTRSGKKNRTSVKGISVWKQESKSLLTAIANGERRALPLFAAFSTEDIHSSRRLSMKPFKDYFLPVSFGYYESLQGNGLFDYWIKRLLVLREGGEGTTEIACVRKAIIDALGPDGCGIMQEMIVRPMQGIVYFKLTDDRSVPATDLSDGYKRLVNIIMDLAFRCALLNGQVYREKACSETKGCVLIDEIDQHLHPSLQAVVLKGLQHAFPAMQFVVTTHAPMVMTSLRNDERNIVYHLEYTDGVYSYEEIHTYGMDASTIIETFMHQQARDARVAEELKELFRLIDDGHIDEARTLLEKMRQTFESTIPELSEAEAMLTFYDEEP